MTNLLTKDDVSQIFLAVKPTFKKYMGKYTHQRISGEWHFHGMGFVKDELTYVFGFNIGFYKKNTETHYSKVGMNVLVRRNGLEPEYRKKLSDFFRENLKDWYTDIYSYSSFRGEEGDEFAKYKNINEFTDKNDIILFLKESIISFSKIYPKIISNPQNIFDNVVRASFPWIDTISDVCEETVNAE